MNKFLMSSKISMGSTEARAARVAIMSASAATIGMNEADFANLKAQIVEIETNLAEAEARIEEAIARERGQGQSRDGQKPKPQ